MIRNLAATLLLVSMAGAAADERVVKMHAHPPSMAIVEATETQLDPISRFVETVYGLVTPLQPAPNYPMYAYPMTEVLSNRSCDSFSDLPATQVFAFVAPIQTEEGSHYLGLRATGADEIHEVCKDIENSPPAAARKLDDFIFTTVARPALLEGANYHPIQDPMHHVATLQSSCSRPFMTASIDPASPDFAYAKAFSDAEWVEVMSKTEELPGKIVNYSTAMGSTLTIALEKAKNDSTFWLVEPPDTEKITEEVFVTSMPALANRAHDERPTVKGEHPLQLIAWYTPPFCSRDAFPWFLMTARRLAMIEPDFRSTLTNLAPRSSTLQ